MFLRNVWYVVAWSNEITRSLLPRTIAGVPIVMFRDEDGTVTALHDRCPHRFAPLSMGTLTGNVIQCGYHGLCFAPTGRCVTNPHSSAIPVTARVRAFPVVERYGLAWLWIGDAERADDALIPAGPVFVDDVAVWRCVSGYSYVHANYELLADNILDASHVDFLHKGFFGNIVGSRQTVRDESGAVTTEWAQENAPNLPVNEVSGALRMNGAPTDQWTTVTWYPPATMCLEVSVVAHGRPRSESTCARALHIMSPETATTSHYFWNNARTYALDDVSVDEELLAALRDVFDGQDKPMIEAVARAMGAEQDLFAHQPVLLSPDVAAIRCRRLLKRLIDEERQTNQPSEARDISNVAVEV